MFWLPAITHSFRGAGKARRKGAQDVDKILLVITRYDVSTLHHWRILTDYCTKGLSYG
jgi:hypothetical protein